MNEDLSWRRFDGLRVGLVGRRGLIPLKLLAAVDNGPRGVHFQDLVTLQPTPDELKEAAKWVQTQDAASIFRQMVTEVVDALRQKIHDEDEADTSEWHDMKTVLTKPISNNAADLVNAIEARVRETALNVCWEQWRTLGALANTSVARPARNIIDPEALVLLTLAVRDDERRLDDFLGWFAEHASRFLSVQRTLNLTKSFPDTLTAGLHAFAGFAADAGDPRSVRSDRLHRSRSEDGRPGDGFGRFRRYRRQQ